MTEIRQEIEGLAEESYRSFQSRLVPGCRTILGVRIPKLRALARRLVKEEGAAVLERIREDSYEEILLQGLILGMLKEEEDRFYERLADYLPKIDNWAVCDTVCAGIKQIRRNRERGMAFLKPRLKSSGEFEVRFAVVLLLDYYIEEEYIDETLRLLTEVVHPGYYAKMAVAWALSMCYIKYPQLTLECMRDGGFDDFIYNKALQKIRESCQVTEETKEYLKSLKR